ncbi:hypothetical protein PLICRDRAFT_125918 [Plicaturopsis crispa FD-325 SS-3]|nr:hypothetical protein PLICRDRAFT_125918 [Plicaturopsis crispa FD-325 SS-3]
MSRSGSATTDSKSLSSSACPPRQKPSGSGHHAAKNVPAGDHDAPPPDKDEGNATSSSDEDTSSSDEDNHPAKNFQQHDDRGNFNPLTDNSHITTRTPRGRQPRSKHIRHATKERVNAKAPNKNRCALENIDPNVAEIQYAHCLPRAAGLEVLDSVEFVRNMEPNSFNVDTRWNIFPLSKRFHKKFDAGEWLLLPEKRYVEAYYNNGDVLVAERFPKFKNGVFNYTVVPLPSMQEDNIIQHPAPGAATSTAVVHHHPYTGLVLRSHLHPSFVLWNTGKKLSDDNAHFAFSKVATRIMKSSDSDTDLVSIMDKAAEIYEVWNTRIDVPLPERLRSVKQPGTGLESSTRSVKRRRVEDDVEHGTASATSPMAPPQSTAPSSSRILSLRPRTSSHRAITTSAPSSVPVCRGDQEPSTKKTRK